MAPPSQTYHRIPLESPLPILTAPVLYILEPYDPNSSKLLSQAAHIILPIIHLYHLRIHSIREFVTEPSHSAFIQDVEMDTSDTILMGLSSRVYNTVSID